MKLSLFLIVVVLSRIDLHGQYKHEQISMDPSVDVFAKRLDSLQSSFFQQSDTLQNLYQSKLDKIELMLNEVRYRKDSLSFVKLPSTRIQCTIDSLNEIRAKVIEDLTEKVRSLKCRTAEDLNKLRVPMGLTKELASVTDRIGSFEIPTTDIDASTDLLTKNALTGLNKINIDADLAEIVQVDELKNISNGVSSISDISDKVNGYTLEIKELKSGGLNPVEDLSASAEAKAVELSGLTDLGKQTESLAAYQETFGQFQNSEGLKSEGLELIQKRAIDHFEGKEKAIQEALQKISKYKSKFPTVKDLTDLPKRRANVMKCQPFIERIIPGIALQLQKKNEDMLTDFNAYLGYRISRRLSAGAGWNQRVGYNTDQYRWSSRKSIIFGPRFYSEYKLSRGFSPRIEVEAMNTFVPPYIRTIPLDLGSRDWVWGVFVGMKKEYTLYKKIKGTAIVMLRLFDPHRKSPYADVINARFGFEFPVKKKVRVAIE